MKVQRATRVISKRIKKFSKADYVTLGTIVVEGLTAIYGLTANGDDIYSGVYAVDLSFFILFCAILAQYFANGTSTFFRIVVVIVAWFLLGMLVILWNPYYDLVRLLLRVFFTWI